VNADDYQKQAARTLIDRPGFPIHADEIMVIWNAIGLAGEAGEVADLVKKGIFHQHGLDRAALVKELGDVLWYVAALCTKLGVSLDDVMQLNIDKLRQRYPEGWSAEASRNRTEEH
jgi:NTP pyrophosphatase (non-canonical NTP hydrolase)